MSTYRASADPRRPICRQFVNKKKCRRGESCHYYHPAIITRDIKKQSRRHLGKCYCGALQRTIINARLARLPDPRPEDGPLFYRVCSRTGKSMRNCY